MVILMIVGFSINKINAEKGKVKKGNINVNYSQDISEVKGAKSSAFEGKLASLMFEFAVNYTQKGENVGEIKFEGDILWKGDAEEVLEQWDEDETLPDKVSQVLTNNLYKRGITQAVGIADSMGMPSPVPLPRVNKN